MTVLIDTSAYYAVMAETDTSHIRAQRIYEALLGEGHELVTVSYVVLETAALLQRRRQRPRQAPCRQGTPWPPSAPRTKRHTKARSAR